MMRPEAGMSLLLPSVLAALTIVVVPQHEHAGNTPEKLGAVHFQTSCKASARAQFDRGVSLLHSFEFGAAIAAFEDTLAVDPACAMAQWGIALSRWTNPFGVGQRSPQQIRQGLEAVTRARAIDAGTPRERAYIEAVANLFAGADRRPQQARVRAYRDAMGRLVRQWPEDTEAAIFYALSLTAAEDPADKTYASRLQALAILEPLFARFPDHPGLAHYIIHSSDVPALASRGLDAASRYAAIAPSAPHALHMPSHTFTRVGLWQRSIEANIASAASARERHVTAEELHATDYEMYAYLQTAQDADARRLLDALPEIASRFDATSTASAAPPAAAFYAMHAIPARWVLERGDWAVAARLETRESGLPYADALTEFARALGAARSGDVAATRTAVARLDALRTREAALKELYWTEQIELQRDSAAAWLAFAEGGRADALKQMRLVAEREDRTEKAAITPGPLAPAREQLGEMLLASGDAPGARAAFEATLAKEPNRFRALHGAARAAALAGDRAAALRYFTRLAAMCDQASDPVRAGLAEARAAVSGQPARGGVRLLRGRAALAATSRSCHRRNA
jgi:hypothetical protein